MHAERVAELIKKLRNKKAQGRWEAAQELYALGPKAKAAVPTLVRLLNDNEVGKECIFILREIGREAKPAIPALTRIFEAKRGDWQRRNIAAIAVGEIDPAVGLMLIKKGLRNCNASVVKAAAHALSVEWRKLLVPLLFRALGHKDYVARDAAETALGDLGRHAGPVLARALKHGNPYIRVHAAHQLGSMTTGMRCSGLQSILSSKKYGPLVVPAVIGETGHPDVFLRRTAVEALEYADRLAAPAVEALRQALKDKDRWVRIHAACALGQIGRAAQSALPELIKALTDKDDAVREYAALAISNSRTRSESAIDPLIKCLNNNNGTIRMYAAGTLGDFGVKARRAIPVLTQAAKKDQKKEVRELAAGSIYRIRRRGREKQPS